MQIKTVVAILCLQSQQSRANDSVYELTTSVVRAVMTMTKEVPSVQSDCYLEMVKVTALTQEYFSVMINKLFGK